MSLELEDEQHKSDVEDLLLKILKELKILNLMVSEASDLEVLRSDIDE
jgi:hypothetical protein